MRSQLYAVAKQTLYELSGDDAANKLDACDDWIKAVVDKEMLRKMHYMPLVHTEKRLDFSKTGVMRMANGNACLQLFSAKKTVRRFFSPVHVPPVFCDKFVKCRSCPNHMLFSAAAQERLHGKRSFNGLLLQCTSCSKLAQETRAAEAEVVLMVVKTPEQILQQKFETADIIDVTA